MVSPERRLLLDTNAPRALAWPNHQFHGLVVTRLERQPVAPRATCALTQLRFVRLSSNPSILRRRITPAESVAMQIELTQDGQHRYLEPLPPLSSVRNYFRRLTGHSQVTDAYLLALAATNDAVLLTLDRRIVPPDSERESIEVLVSSRF